MTAEYRVLWNGCKDHSGGRLLFTEEGETQPAPPLRPLRHDTDVVREACKVFGDRWFTAVEMSLATGLSFSKTHAAIASLIGNGEIDRERKGLMHRQRSSERQRYRVYRDAGQE